MSDQVQLLLQYGYLLLFVVVLAGQIGPPIPAVPVLLGAGALVGAGAWTSLGYIFSDALEVVASYSARLGNAVLGVVGAALVAYIGVKFIQRRRFLRSLRIARIKPEELKQRLDSGGTDLA